MTSLLVTIAVAAEIVGRILPGSNDGAWMLRIGFVVLLAAVRVVFYANEHHTHRGPADGPEIDDSWFGSCALVSLLGVTLIFIGVYRRLESASRVTGRSRAGVPG